MNTENEYLFVKLWRQVAAEAHETSRAKGWWDRPQTDGEFIALVHSEISEALEAMRHHNPPDDKIPEYSGVEAELADAIIRIMDVSEGRGWNVAGALLAKMRFNASRPHKHGGKAF